MALTIDQIRAEIDRLLEKGDETALEAFMLEHFEDLPKEVQGQMLLAHYSDALAAKIADSRITDLQEGALDALESLKEEKE